MPSHSPEENGLNEENMISCSSHTLSSMRPTSVALMST